MSKHSTNSIRCEFDGNRLYGLRVERGITMLQLAKALGMSESTISFYESGDRTPSFEACGKICNFFWMRPELFVWHIRSEAFFFDRHWQ